MKKPLRNVPVARSLNVHPVVSWPFFYLGNYRKSVRYIRDEYAIHDIQVKPIGLATVDHFNIFLIDAENLQIIAREKQ